MGHMLDASDELSVCLMHRDGGRYDLSVYLGLSYWKSILIRTVTYHSHGNGVFLGLCHCVAVVVARITGENVRRMRAQRLCRVHVVDDSGRVTSFSQRGILQRER